MVEAFAFKLRDGYNNCNKNNSGVRVLKETQNLIWDPIFGSGQNFSGLLSIESRSEAINDLKQNILLFETEISSLNTENMQRILIIRRRYGGTFSRFYTNLILTEHNLLKQFFLFIRSTQI